MGGLGQRLRRTEHLDLWITATSRASQFPAERAPHRYQLLAKKAPGFWCLPVEDETFYRYSYTLSNTNFGCCS